MGQKGFAAAKPFPFGGGFPLRGTASKVIRPFPAHELETE